MQAVGDSKVTIDFFQPDRLGGSATCNRFNAGFELTGERGGIEIQPAATTLMACPTDEQMEQERYFLDILQAVRRFEIGRGEVLLLEDADGRSLRARREP